MGMFDTFHIQNQGRHIAVQSKEFACILNDYRLGDIVEYETNAPRGIQSCVEDHKQDWRDHDYVEWQEREAKGEADTRMFGFMRHDFSKETWDWAIARLLLELPEYRKRVPAGYGVAMELEVLNPEGGVKP